MGNSKVFMNFEPIKICSCIIGDANLTNFKINYALLLGNLRRKQQSGRYGMKHKNTVERGGGSSKEIGITFFQRSNDRRCLFLINL